MIISLDTLTFKVQTEDLGFTGGKSRPLLVRKTWTECLHAI